MKVIMEGLEGRHRQEQRLRSLGTWLGFFSSCPRLTVPNKKKKKKDMVVDCVAIMNLIRKTLICMTISRYRESAVAVVISTSFL